MQFIEVSFQYQDNQTLDGGNHPSRRLEDNVFLLGLIVYNIKNEPAKFF